MDKLSSLVQNRGRSLLWDATVVYTFAHVIATRYLAPLRQVLQKQAGPRLQNAKNAMTLTIAAFNQS